MHAVDLIAATLTDDQKFPVPVEPARGVCCVTGEETMTIPRKKLFGSSFLDANILAAPASDRVGVNAWHAMQFGEYGKNEDGTLKKVRRKPEMRSCWWTDGRTFSIIGKSEIRKMVLNGSPSVPWAGWVTTSYKKHGALRAPVNMSSYGVWAFDDLLVDCRDVDRVKAWWQTLRNAQKDNIGRTAMAAASMPPALAARIGLDVWLPFQTWASERYQSPLYRFLVYLLPSQAEIKEGYADDESL